nr:immunoglobulin heavy chain junction region [Mus musculus]
CARLAPFSTVGFDYW